MNLLICAGASTRIGTGHVMRCLALAQAWQDRGGQAVFAMAEEVPALRSRLETEGFELRWIEAQRGDGRDAAETVELARRLAISWVAAIEIPELIP